MSAALSHHDDHPGASCSLPLARFRDRFARIAPALGITIGRLLLSQLLTLYTTPVICNLLRPACHENLQSSAPPRRRGARSSGVAMSLPPHSSHRPWRPFTDRGNCPGGGRRLYWSCRHRRCPRLTSPLRWAGLFREQVPRPWLPQSRHRWSGSSGDRRRDGNDVNELSRRDRCDHTAVDSEPEYRRGGERY